eukprot:7990411-Alexandrium_andersonii.AAC.1
MNDEYGKVAALVTGIHHSPQHFAAAGENHKGSCVRPASAAPQQPQCDGNYSHGSAKERIGAHEVVRAPCRRCAASHEAGSG